MKILIILYFLHFISFAQRISIEGYVKDSETGNPLINANVYFLAGKGLGAATNEQGFFKLKEIFEISDTLLISYVGYETKRISMAELFGIPSVPTSDGGVIYNFYLNKKI